MLQSAPPHLQHSIVHLENMTWCTSTLKDRRSLHGCRRCLEKELLLPSMARTNGILDGFQTIIPTAAAVLSKKRQMLRLTQQEIADRAKITLRQYQRLESGERSILTCSFGLACRVIEALDMDVSKFYHGDYYLEELKTIEGK